MLNQFLNRTVKVIAKLVQIICCGVVAALVGDLGECCAVYSCCTGNFFIGYSLRSVEFTISNKFFQTKSNHRQSLHQ